MILRKLKLVLSFLSLLFLFTIISCSSDELNEKENATDEVEKIEENVENEESEENQRVKIELLTKIDATDIVIGPEVLIETNITDEDGEVTEANLLINGEVIQTIYSSPFNFKWDTSLEEEGEFQIKITAKDNEQAESYFETTAILTSSFDCGKDFFDPRDGNIYKTIKIGEQCWMAENLNYNIDGGSWDYDDKPENGQIYGKLYTQEAALIASPDGWHLPSDEEWKTLEGTVDSQLEVGNENWDEWSYRGYDAGDNLKSESGWEEDGNGKDKFGFNALPGGYKILNSSGSGYYENINFSAPFWTSTSEGAKLLWGRELFATKQSIHRIFYNDGWALAVRSIKD